MRTRSAVAVGADRERWSLVAAAAARNVQQHRAADEAHGLGRLERRPRADDFKKVVAEYDRKHPEVTVKVVGGIDDNKIVAAIRSGTAPDVVSSFNSYNVGNYCGTGGWIDLAPLLKKDHIDPSIFPPATRYYTQYGGKRCALPLLADDYGLYYNKKLFKAAGIKRPPKTISELTADAKKLTVRDKSGQDQGRRLRPVRSASTRTRPSGGSSRSAASGSTRRPLADRQGPRLGEVGQVAEEPRRLVRLRQARQVPGAADRRVLAVAGVRDRQARDELRRRMARRVHPQRASEPRLRHGADAGRRRPSRAVRLRLHQRHDHRHPARRASTRTRRGPSSST